MKILISIIKINNIIASYYKMKKNNFKYISKYFIINY